MEQLENFVEDLFDGEVASLPIPPEVISQATDLVHDMREDSAKINNLERIEMDILVRRFCTIEISP